MDLSNIFVGSYHVHVIYLAMKMLSVGMWAYTQTAIGHVALWIIPIGLTMIVAVILLEWFSNLRRYALIFLIVVGSCAWIGIVVMRSLQISTEIEQTKAAMVEADKEHQARFETLINEQVCFRICLIRVSKIILKYFI